MSPQKVASVSNLENSQSQRAGNMGNEECCSGFVKSAQSFPGREVKHNRGPTGSLELHERRESWKDPKYPRKILVREMLESMREGRGPTGSPLGKGVIASDMILDRSDTISCHVPVQRTQLRS